MPHRLLQRFQSSVVSHIVSCYTCTFSLFLSLGFTIIVKKKAGSKEKSVFIHTHSVDLSLVRHKQEQGGQY